jgi:hypothetical protein
MVRLRLAELFDQLRHRARRGLRAGERTRVSTASAFMRSEQA